jgi:sterol desaturase/sphingolipid hydroxylase (fatty acid hydroxylase superfamily)
MMDWIVDYFSSISSAHRTLILVSGIVLFWVIESAVPLFPLRYSKLRHAGVNFFFTLTTILVNFALAFILLSASDWAQSYRFGLLHWLPSMPLIVQALIGVMLLDLIGAYLAHWTEHQVKWMWRFHLIHHTDTYVDTTTATRHHPGESFIRFAFTTMAVILVGAPMWMVMVYQSLSALLSQFNHANIGLPASIDRYLSWFIVTPDMHHLHHHVVQPYTDSNYGNIFAIWDRLLGTYRTLPRQELIYGIDTYPEPTETSHIGRLLKIPFERYRDPPGSKFS